jgi:hypothetical protein
MASVGKKWRAAQDATLKLCCILVLNGFSGAQLIALGNYMDIDPFAPYRTLLNPQAKTTTTEKKQAQKITELEEKIIALEKERDWLKEVVMKK